MSVLAMYCNEDAEIYYVEINAALWNEKLDHLHKAALQGERDGFIDAFNGLLNSGEISQVSPHIFDEVPAEVMARVKRVVLVSTWL